MSNDSPVSGWYVFAGVLLGIAGVLNVIWGIAAISSVLPALCFILPGALVIGLVFGYFTARGLTRRVRAVASLLAST